MNPINFEEKLISEIVIEYVVTKRPKSYQLSHIALLVVIVTVFSILTYKGIVHIYFIVALLLSAAATAWLYNTSNVTEESILIIRDFGIQLRQKYYHGNEITKVKFIHSILIYIHFLSLHNGDTNFISLSFHSLSIKAVSARYLFMNTSQDQQ